MSMLIAATEVLDILQTKGYKAYFVGGYVRDEYMNRPYSDIDITTNAKPEEISRMFKTFPTGIRFGTVLVVYKTYNFEITTFRKEDIYINNRHPVNVSFTNDLNEDLKRRDFTMNAIAKDLDGNIIDIFFGREDIEKKIIRAIGNPTKRFEEDALRILRAFVFVSKLGFTIEEKTKEGIMKCNHLLKEISNERILAEVTKMINGENFVKAVKMLLELNTHIWLPGLEKGLKSLKNSVKEDVFFGFCFVLYKEIPNEWKFSKKKRKKYEMCLEFVLNEMIFDAINVYKYGLDFCLYVNKVLMLLDKGIKEDVINRIYNDLAIHEFKDINMGTNDLFKYIKDVKLFSKVQKDIEEKIVISKLDNNNESIIDYIKSRWLN